MISRRMFLAAGAAALTTSQSALAQSGYPDHNMRLVVGYPAGGGVDIVARLVIDPMREALGQPVIVENRAGAAAMIAAQAVAKAGNDGHTLLMAAAGEIAVNKHLYKEKMTYQPETELVPIALAGIVPCLVVVADTSPVRTPADLIAYAKANKGKLTYSSSGVGNPQHLAGELMNKMAGTDVQHVPYRGSTPAVTDIAAGAVTMSFSSLGAALPLIQAGKIRPVAVTSRERMPQLPDVAPLSDALPGYELLNWFAMFAPAATPQPILARLTDVMPKIMQRREIKEQLAIQGIVSRNMSDAELRAFVRSESDKFAKIIQDANITLGN